MVLMPASLHTRFQLPFASFLFPRGCFLQLLQQEDLVVTILYYLPDGITTPPPNTHPTQESRKKWPHGCKGRGHIGVMDVSAVISATN